MVVRADSFIRDELGLLLLIVDIIKQLNKFYRIKNNEQKFNPSYNYTLNNTVAYDVE